MIIQLAKSSNYLKLIYIIAVMGAGIVGCGSDSSDDSGVGGSNAFQQKNFAANKEEYGAVFTIPEMVNAWGIATRPAGAGGHFWIAASGISHEFVGDVTQSADPSLQTIFQDGLKKVEIPNGGSGTGTGMVFNEGTQFIITETIDGAAPITAPAKFITATDNGIVSAWTERKKSDGTFDRSPTFTEKYDGSADGSQFFGAALSEGFDRLYLADFGSNPGIVVLDGSFHKLPITFDNPFDDNQNGKVDAGEFTPWNVQTLTYPDGHKSLFLAYVKTKECPGSAIKDGICTAGTFLPGEEDSYEGEEEGNHPDKGRVAEFTFDGRLIAVWNDLQKLNAPWGFAFSPDNFGSLSGKLLVGNFGGKGKIAAFDPGSRTLVDFMKDAGGEAIHIPGLWGLVFGNGASLGDANALYFTAGPGDEVDGLFGSLRPLE